MFHVQTNAFTLTEQAEVAMPDGTLASLRFLLTADKGRDRCGVLLQGKTRSGKSCKSPVVSGKKRCRMHDGAPGSGAPRGNKNALKNGRYTREAIEERRRLRAFLRQSRVLIQKIK